MSSSAIPPLELCASFKVGSWNLQNYLIDNRFEDGQFLFAHPMPELRKNRIREQILLQRPDILFLQEIGSSAFLLELQKDLAAAGLPYPYANFNGFDGARSGLAVLSQIPPDEVVFHDLSLRRGVQEVRFQFESTCYRFFHVHLKSRYSTDPADPHSTAVRAREITILANALDRLFSVAFHHRFFVLGDFNTPVADDLLLPLKRHWTRLQMTDANADPHTYFHHAGEVEILDGFWIHKSSNLSPHGSLQPLPHICPSDHRFLILSLPPPS